MFSDEVGDYQVPFGTAGKGNNFWFGLDNMNAITASASYNLYVEVCCGQGSTQQQRYHSFTVELGRVYCIQGRSDWGRA